MKDNPPTLPRTPGEWLDCGHGTLAHPVTGTQIATRVVEAKGFGRIGEWYDYSNEPEGNFQSILRAVNRHDRPFNAVETAAAISAGVHGDRKKYRQCYAMLGDCPSISGFPGIWKLCADCAEELEGRQDWESDDWIDVCDTIAHTILALERPIPAKDIVDCALAHHAKRKVA